MWPCPYNRRTDEQRFPGRDVVASLRSPAVLPRIECPAAQTARAHASFPMGLQTKRSAPPLFVLFLERLRACRSPVHSPSGPSHSSRQILCWHHRLRETGTRPSVPQRPSKMASSFPAGWLSCHSPPIAIGYYRRKSVSLPRGSATPPCTPNPERAGAYSGLHVRELCPETSTGPAARRVCPHAQSRNRQCCRDPMQGFAVT